jgi:hypothetical protein
MSEELDRLIAAARFREYLTRLSPFQGEQGFGYEIKEPLAVPMMVPREEVVNKFLTTHPEFEPFREAIGEVYQESLPKEFPLHSEKWAAANK